MGSSNWTYFTPYQEDIKQALQELRRNVFEAGDYERFWLYVEVPEEAFDALDEISWTGTDQHLFCASCEASLKSIFGPLGQENAS